MNDKIKSILLAVEALAFALDFGRDGAEQALSAFESELKSITDAERSEIRRRMIFIIAQLSRLEVRLISSDGPMQRAV
jgi:hypothetical protein